MKISYLKYLAYTLIALGGINFVYQNEKSNIKLTAGLSIISGLLTSIIVFVPRFAQFASKRAVQFSLTVIALLVIASQFINL